eukprot:m.210889 g.210889  ORF g.210889 m.210889 type:complete len:82 (+) comp15828_c0_seq8:73-318(+)
MSGSGKGGKLQPRMTKVNPRAEIVKLAEKRKELQRDLEVLETQVFVFIFHTSPLPGRHSVDLLLLLLVIFNDLFLIPYLLK